MSHSHHHDDHDHHHEHDNRYSDMQARVKALETLLAEKGLIDPAAIDAIVETYETKIGPRNGAAVVAKAWSDPDFAEWLKRDATARSPASVIPADRASICVPCSIRPTPTIWSSARSAPAIRGRFLACRRSGTRRPPTARAPSSILVLF